MTQVDRRSFIVTLGGAALALTGCARMAPGAVVTSASKRKLSRIGLQLYTVRTQARADLPGTLAQLARIGYKEIEFWGQYSLTPAQIRAQLDANGLTSPSVHIGLPREAAGWTPILDSARALGNQWIIAASPPFQAKTVVDWKRLATVFTEAGKRVKDAGFRFGFHNHTEMGQKVDGIVPFDILLGETDPSLVNYELDVHWAYAGGLDPIELLTKHPTRFRMLHIKDSMGAPGFKQADVGAGTYPWAKVFDAAANAGVEHYFVEHDGPVDAMVFAKTSFDYLSTLTY